MPLITADEAKTHARIDTGEDVQAMVDAAIGAVANDLGLAVDDLPDAAPVKAAALLIFGGLYEYRESEQSRPMIRNPAVDRLLAPYRVYG